VLDEDMKKVDSTEYITNNVKVEHESYRPHRKHEKTKKNRKKENIHDQPFSYPRLTRHHLGPMFDKHLRDFHRMNMISRCIHHHTGQYILNEIAYTDDYCDALYQI
jgi:hypothetical protein